DTITVGTGNEALIGAAVSVSGGTRSTSLIVDDDLDTTARTAVLNATSLVWTGFAPSVSWTPNTAAASQMQLTVLGGKGGNSFTVTSTGSLSRTPLKSGAGNDVVAVKATAGALVVEGVAGLDTVTVGDGST